MVQTESLLPLISAGISFGNSKYRAISPKLLKVKLKLCNKAQKHMRAQLLQLSLSLCQENSLQIDPVKLTSAHQW